MELSFAFVSKKEVCVIKNENVKNKHVTEIKQHPLLMNILFYFYNVISMKFQHDNSSFWTCFTLFFYQGIDRRKYASDCIGVLFKEIKQLASDKK
jgi:hypothetical protein